MEPHNDTLNLEKHIYSTTKDTNVLDWLWRELGPSAEIRCLIVQMLCGHTAHCSISTSSQIKANWMWCRALTVMVQNYFEGGREMGEYDTRYLFPQHAFHMTISTTPFLHLFKIHQHCSITAMLHHISHKTSTRQTIPVLNLDIVLRLMTFAWHKQTKDIFLHGTTCCFLFNNECLLHKTVKHNTFNFSLFFLHMSIGPVVLVSSK